MKSSRNAKKRNSVSIEAVEEEARASTVGDMIDLQGLIACNRQSHPAAHRLCEPCAVYAYVPAVSVSEGAVTVLKRRSVADVNSETDITRASVFRRIASKPITAL